MASDNHPPSSLTETQRAILRAIGWWYNGVPAITPDGDTYQLGKTTPPELIDLLRAFEDTTLSQTEWKTRYEPAHANLKATGWVTTTPMFQADISWAPTEQARVFLTDALSSSDQYASDVPTPGYDGGIVGDRAESLTHRAGVELLAAAFDIWGFDSVRRYPETEHRLGCDLYAARDGIPWAGEVLVWHDDHQLYKDTYRYTCNLDRNIFYLFEDPALANTCINCAVSDDESILSVMGYPFDPQERTLIGTKGFLRESVERRNLSTPGIHDLDTMTHLFQRLRPCLSCSHQSLISSPTWSTP